MTVREAAAEEGGERSRRGVGSAEEADGDGAGGGQQNEIDSGMGQGSSI